MQKKTVSAQSAMLVRRLHQSPSTSSTRAAQARSSPIRSAASASQKAISSSAWAATATSPLLSTLTAQSRRSPAWASKVLRQWSSARSTAFRSTAATQSMLRSTAWVATPQCWITRWQTTTRQLSSERLHRFRQMQLCRLSTRVARASSILPIPARSASRTTPNRSQSRATTISCSSWIRPLRQKQSV